RIRGWPHGVIFGVFTGPPSAITIGGMAREGDENGAPGAGTGAPSRIDERAAADLGYPASTYRLQLTPNFGFAEAAAIVPYLDALGVTHLYLSPPFEAAPGSTHGYDVIDHNRLRAELGGELGFEKLTAVARRQGLGQIIDVVPNHMGIGPLNAW